MTATDSFRLGPTGTHGDSCPLSPIQEGMLFHWLRDRHCGTDIEQIVAELHEAIDPARLEASWRRPVSEFGALRTAFVWEGLASPAQYIDDGARLPFEVHDLRDLADGDRVVRIREFIRNDRRKGFNLAAAPATRVALFQLGETEFQMVWTFHHILFDTRSCEIILDRVFTEYDSGSATGTGPANETPYREYVDWIATQNGDVARDFWRAKLAGFTATTPLPHAEPVEPASDPFDEARVGLSESATDDLRALAARQRFSVESLVVAAWALLLARHTGEPEVVFGVADSTRGRTIPGADEMVGLFLATIPIRVAVDQELSVVEWLRRVRDEWALLRGHEHVPLVDIKQGSPVPASASLFDSLVMLERYELGQRLRSKGGAWERRSVAAVGQPGYPLALTAYDGDALGLKLDYDTRQFDRQTVHRLLGHLTTILGGWASNPDGAVWQVPMLTELERQRVLHEWNDTPMQHPQAACIHELFEAQASVRGDAVALVHGGTALTYAQLNERANRLAHHLRRRGIGPDVLVGVSAERSVEMVVGLLGVLKAGGAYVPLDPAYPAERLAFMLGDSAPAMVLVQGAGAALATGSVPVLDLADESALADEPTTNLPRDGGTSRNLAYVIYTSGSTGTPKGVMVEHANVTRLLTATEAWYHFGPEDVWTLFHSYAFDFSVWEIWGAFAYGGRLVVVPQQTARAPQEFYKLLCDEGVTVLNQTPSAFRQLVAAQEESELQRHALRYVIFGGEALEMATLRPWYERERNASTQLVNMYGITETTVHVTYRPLQPVDALRAGASPIGKRIPDLQIYILDSHRDPVPVGVEGELFVGGAGVARGYLNRPDLNAQRFVNDPFHAGGRIYTTGDTGRFLADGSIEYLGRNDDQVKIRGFRIELGEIENALAAQAGVREAVVIAREDTPGDRRLVAYVVAETGILDASELRAALKSRLPEYMLPSAFVQLERLPTTPSGKIDRRALPAPTGAEATVKRAIVGPRTYLERQMADVWESVFKVSPISVTDSFWDLGGHSMLAVRLMARIAQAFGKRIPLNTLFEAPTVEQLAKHLEDDSRVHGRHTLVPARVTGSRPPLYWIPGGAALGMFSLKHLVPALGDDVPVYGLGSAFPNTVEDVERVEERAAQYLSLIRRVQPQGPYFFVGYCAGGVIAFEMAQLLIRENEQIGLLGMINCSLPGVPSGRVEKIRFKVQRLRHQLQEANQQGIGFVGYFRDRQKRMNAHRAEQERVSRATERVKREGFKDNGEHQYRVVLELTDRAIERYQVRQYPGPVALFVSDDPSLRGVGADLDPRLAWDRVSTRRDVYVCEGNHESVLGLPYALSLASRLRSALESAWAELAESRP